MKVILILVLSTLTYSSSQPLSSSYEKAESQELLRCFFQQQDFQTDINDCIEGYYTNSCGVEKCFKSAGDSCENNTSKALIHGLACHPSYNCQFTKFKNIGWRCVGRSIDGLRQWFPPLPPMYNHFEKLKRENEFN